MHFSVYFYARHLLDMFHSQSNAISLILLWPVHGLPLRLVLLNQWSLLVSKVCSFHHRVPDSGPHGKSGVLVPSGCSIKWKEIQQGNWIQCAIWNPSIHPNLYSRRILHYIFVFTLVNILYICHTRMFGLANKWSWTSMIQRWATIHEKVQKGPSWGPVGL